ncbi:DUF1244 domain-containing protein [Sneathiella aquimaris]|uniref:DUF1244 domain-containing protein n=1 Tax=Sneathiella aquimaris TaxID=2599305 RepID=UPI00146E62D0|nr:DUF1244 domain-containing protein [Sneathiella aquimaris]
MTDETTLKLEAAAFRRLREHLQARTDVQNIDLMNLAGFCRNCLSNWYQEAAEEAGLEMDKAQAREIVYGMPYEEWKSKHQAEATDEQKEKFKTSHPGH